jgi:hypothetical protein
MARHSSQILELARTGAEHRYAELKAEIAALVRQFPHLRSPRAMSATGSGTAGSGRPRRRRMSAAARKAVSERMKRYWAARRAGRKK